MSLHRALRRDDLLMPYSFAAAFLVHLLLVLILPGLPKIDLENLPEYVAEGVRVKIFSMPSTFSRFSANQRLYAQNNPNGVPFATSGNVRVDASAVSVPPGTLVPYASPDGQEIPTSSNRLYLGARGTGAAAPSAPREAGGEMRSGLWAPPSDEGDFLARDAANASGHFGAEGRTEGSSSAPAARVPTGRSTNDRVGSTGAEAEAPGAAAPALRTPRPVAGTPGFRAVATPTSAGPNVSPRPVESEVEGEEDVSASAGARRRRIISKPLPEYPSWAEEQHVEANVIFDITVSQTGRVIGTPKLVRTSGYMELDRRALEAVRNWIYEPIAGQEEIRRPIIQFVLKRR